MIWGENANQIIFSSQDRTLTHRRSYIIMIDQNDMEWVFGNEVGADQAMIK